MPGVRTIFGGSDVASAKRRHATPATQMERQCHQVPLLPRKVARHPGGLTALHQRQPSATPATQNAGCCQAPRLPRKWNVNVTNVAKCRACHANGTSRSPSATPATQSGNGAQACHQRRSSARSAMPATQNTMSPSARPAT